jgi:REase_DpnII-MboI
VSPPTSVTPLSASNALPSEADHLPITKKICQRFHFVARQLRLRGEYRSSVSVEDESDVQDLLHALLRLQFDDISTDEWTPGYSNGASRTTFLLNHDRLAVVAKKTRAGLTMKDLKDQVRADIERYRARGRCTHLLCFIYDPDGRIGNPRGVESELASISEQFTVDIVVAPK